MQWDTFCTMFQKDFGKQSDVHLQLMRRVLDKEDLNIVSVFELADWTNEVGLQAAFSKLTAIRRRIVLGEPNFSQHIRIGVL